MFDMTTTELFSAILKILSCLIWGWLMGTMIGKRLAVYKSKSESLELMGGDTWDLKIRTMGFIIFGLLLYAVGLAFILVVLPW